MSLESDGEHEWRPRPVMLPTFRLSSRMADHLSWGLLVAAVASVVAGLVTATSYRNALPTNGASGTIPAQLDYHFNVSFADRVALFARDGASLLVALLVMVAVVVSAMAVSVQGESEGSPRRRWSKLLVSLAVMAAIVVLGTVAHAIVALSTTLNVPDVSLSSDKLTAILSLLPAALTASAAFAYAVITLTTADREVEEAIL